MVVLKKIMVILSVLFTLSLAGILYGRLTQPDEGKVVTAEQVYMNQFPAMPELIMEPMTGYPLY